MPDDEQAKALFIERFPPALRRRAKASAALQGKYLRDFLLHAIEAEVARCESAAAATVAERHADTRPGDVITTT